MGFDGLMHALGMVFQVFFLDLILSGDNAVLIALACRSLPQRQMRKAMLIGTGFAIFLRVVLTTGIALLLQIPSVRLIGGFALLYIALKLIVEEGSEFEDEIANEIAAMRKTSAPVVAKNRVWQAIRIVVVADVVMSLDNVVALAAVAQNNIFLLVLGLLFSISLLMVGSLFVAKLLNRYPILVPTVGALLGWIAGGIGVSDPLIADWVNTQSPALPVAMPFLCAIFVILQSKIIKQSRLTLETGVSKRVRRRPFSSLLLPMGEPSSTAEDADDFSSNAVLESSSGQSQATAAATVDESMIALQAAQSTNPAMPETPQRPQIFPRRKALVVAAAAIALLAAFFIVNFLRTNFMPAPAQLIRYDCPGFRGRFALYYRHGGEHIQIRSDGHVVDGNTYYGKIEWENYKDASAALGFMLPDEITAESAKSIQINGGNFLQITCARNE